KQIKKGEPLALPFFKSNVRSLRLGASDRVGRSIGTTAAAAGGKRDAESCQTDACDDQDRIAFHLRLLHARRLSSRECRRRKGVRRQQAGSQDGCTQSP